jgi:hypothetical protein
MHFRGPERYDSMHILLLGELILKMDIFSFNFQREREKGEGSCLSPAGELGNLIPALARLCVQLPLSVRERSYRPALSLIRL